MSMDGFSSGLILEVAKKNGTDAGGDLYKMLGKTKGGPSDEARKFFEDNKGKFCKVLGTTHTGIIQELNEATGGFYPGERYPIYVKITSPSAPGWVFEYDLDQLEIIN